MHDQSICQASAVATDTRAACSSLHCLQAVPWEGRSATGTASRRLVTGDIMGVRPACLVSADTSVRQAAPLRAPGASQPVSIGTARVRRVKGRRPIPLDVKPGASSDAQHFEPDASVRTWGSLGKPYQGSRWAQFPASRRPGSSVHAVSALASRTYTCVRCPPLQAQVICRAFAHHSPDGRFWRPTDSGLLGKPYGALWLLRWPGKLRHNQAVPTLLPLLV